jgi:hypothetical protein
MNEEGCPFCGRGTECPHFVTEISEWPENFAGTEGGPFGEVANSCLGSLFRAIREALTSHGSTAPWITTLEPARLKAVVQAVAQDAEERDEEDDLSQGFGAEGSIGKTGFAEYLKAVFRDSGAGGQITVYDTDDHWGTCPLLL